MTRPSILLRRFEDALEDVAHKRRWWIGEAILATGICAEIWIGVVRSAALWHGGP